MVKARRVRVVRLFTPAAGWVLVSVACGGGAPPPTRAPAPPPPVVRVEVVTPPPPRPESVAVWVHVEEPARLAALVAAISDRSKPDAKGDPLDLATLVSLADLDRPADLAQAASDGNREIEAAAFSVPSAADLRARAARRLRVTDVGPGMLRLGPGEDSLPTDDAGAPPDAGATLTCDIRGADRPEHRVVCGTEQGVRDFGAWLATSPRPLANDCVARAEVYPAPFIAKIDKQWPDKNAAQTGLREATHDFEGATVRLTVGGTPDAPIEVDVDVRTRASSRWTKLLLTPAASGAAVPEAFARLPRGTTAAFYLPGGGPLAAFAEDNEPGFAALEHAGQRAAADEARAVLRGPMACGYALDLDEAEKALAQARKALGQAQNARPKDRKEADAALDDAFEGFIVCGLSLDGKSAEALERKILAVTPPKPGEVTTIHAAGPGLPAGSFVVETTHTAPPPPPHALPKGASRTPPPPPDETVVVADGDTTWLVGATHHGASATRLARRMLARPRGPVTAFALPPGTTASVYVTTLFGAFFMDLAGHNLGAVATTLATLSPALLQVAMTQHAETAGGTLSFHLQATPATISTVSPRLLLVASPFLFMAAMSLVKDPAGSK